MRLQIGQTIVQSIFRLAGTDEDSLTYALGFLLANDTHLCQKFVRLCGVKPQQSLTDDYVIRLQEATLIKSGRRDIAIESQENKFRIVVEAKIGGSEPSADQLLKYACDEISWKGFKHRTITTLTHVELSSSVQDAVASQIARKGMHLEPIQWHQIVEIVSRHSPSDDSLVSRYLLDEFLKHINRDYDMQYYDVEVLIQDTNPCNAKIFEEGWVQVSSHKTKQAPLYVAPYYTQRGPNSGIKKISRVIATQLVRLVDCQGIPDPETEEQRKRWQDGLSMVKQRAEKEGFSHDQVRLFFLDQPLKFRKIPLSKKAYKSTAPRKQIPQMIPQGFSLRFDELLPHFDLTPSG